MLFFGLLHCDHGQILTCIKFSCTEWGPSPHSCPPLASTSLQKERDDLTDILDVDPPFPAPQLWPGRSWLPASSLLDRLLLPVSVPCHRPPSLLPQGQSLDSCCLCPASCICAKTPPVTAHPPPGARPPAFHSCPFAFAPRPGASTSICRALRQQWLSPSEIKHRIMSPAPKFSRCVIHPTSPLPSHHHLNKSQKALFSSIR